MKTYEAELPNQSSFCPVFRGDFHSAAAACCYLESPGEDMGPSGPRSMQRKTDAVKMSG